MKYLDISGPAGPVARVWLADNYFLRLRGLIGRTLTPTGGLLLKPCRQIHTWFMSGAMDAVYLDRNWQVLRVEAELPPGRMRPAVSGCRFVLELSPGRAAACGLERGVQLQWRQVKA